MDEVDSQFIGGGKKLSVGGQNIIKRLKGSEKLIIDPLEQDILRTYQVVNLITRNQVAKSVGELSKVTSLVKKIKTPVIPVAKEGEKLIFRPVMPGRTDLDVIEVLNKGKREFYQVPKEVGEAMKGLNDAGRNILTEVFSVPSKLLRATATSGNPEFALPNIVRDQISAAINSRYGTGFNFKSFVSALAGKSLDEDTILNYYLNGGGMATLVRQDTVGLVARVLEDTASSKWIKGRNIKQITSPKEWFHFIQQISEGSELGTRAGVFGKGMRKQGQKLLTKSEIAQKFNEVFLNPSKEVLEATVNAKEATINFSTRGAKMADFNAITAFFNANLQGYTRLGKSLKNSKKAQTVFASLSILLAVNEISNRDNPGYQDIPDYVKDRNIVFMYGDKAQDSIMIPIGQFGFVKYLTRRTIDAMQEQSPEAYARLGGEIIKDQYENMINTAMPNAFRTIAEPMANYSFFKGRPIVSKYDTELPQKYQTSVGTPSILNLLGEKTNLSPAKIQNVLQNIGIGAGIGKMGLEGISTLTEKLGISKPKAIPQYEPSQQGSKIPILRRFLGAAGGAKDYQSFQELNRLATEEKGKGYEKKQDAINLYNELKDLPKEQRSKIIDGMIENKQLDQETYNKYVEIKKGGGLTTFERSLKGADTDVRAKMIYDEIKDLPQEERSRKLDEYEEKKILTQMVYDKYLELRKQK